MGPIGTYYRSTGSCCFSSFPGLLVLQISRALERFGMKPRSCSKTHRLPEKVREVPSLPRAAAAFVIDVQAENLSKTSSQQLLVTVGLDMRRKQKFTAQVKTISLVAEVTLA